MSKYRVELERTIVQRAAVWVEEAPEPRRAFELALSDARANNVIWEDEHLTEPVVHEVSNMDDLVREYNAVRAETHAEEDEQRKAHLADRQDELWWRMNEQQRREADGP